MYVAFPRSDYYGPSAPPRVHQPTAGLPTTTLAVRRGGRSRSGSHVHHQPIDGVGTQLFPCSLATSTPQAFLVASSPAHETGFGVAARIICGQRALLSGPHPPGWSRLPPLEGSSTGSLALHLSVSLAGPGSSGGVDPSRRCRGCFPPFPVLPGSGCPLLQRPAATDRRRVLSTHPVDSASWRTRARGNNPRFSWEPSTTMLTNRLSGTTEASVSDRNGPRNSAPRPFARQRLNQSQNLRSSRRAPERLYVADQGLCKVRDPNSGGTAQAKCSGP